MFRFAKDGAPTDLWKCQHIGKGGADQFHQLAGHRGQGASYMVCQQQIQRLGRGQRSAPGMVAALHQVQGQQGIGNAKIC